MVVVMVASLFLQFQRFKSSNNAIASHKKAHR